VLGEENHTTEHFKGLERTLFYFLPRFFTRLVFIFFIHLLHLCNVSEVAFAGYLFRKGLRYRLLAILIFCYLYVTEECDDSKNYDDLKAYIYVAYRNNVYDESKEYDERHICTIQCQLG
jgi:uncharacterized membrane protein